MTSTRRCMNCLTPPHLLRKLLESSDRDIRESALNTLLVTAGLRGERSVRATFADPAPANGRRTIFDCRNGTDLDTSALARSEDGAASPDAAANRAFDGLGITRDFYKKIFDRNSIDDEGLRLDGYVHFDQNYNNAGWDGRRMIFGDGDGMLFTDFTLSLDVIGHELTHGVTQYMAGLEYEQEPGALNESISDVFGSLIKQWSLGQTAATADWLIGAEIFTPAIAGDSLRSMKAPGTAYNNPTMGKDPQPDHYSRYVHTTRDHGGVHINSGIPNKAFYLVAASIGGKAWEAPGHIWYESLRASNKVTDFEGFATKTYMKAEELYGGNSIEQQAVLSAWKEVGVKISGPPPGGGGRPRARVVAEGGRAMREEDSFTALAKQIEALSGQVKSLAKDIESMKGKR
jgi:Zn-dependent metalloprotease